MKFDPILAVADIRSSSDWYEAIFECRSKHGGDTFEVLVDENEEVFLCLHKWGEHDHPTFKNPDSKSGNGLILYFRTKNLEKIYHNTKGMGYSLETEIIKNPNSGVKEFSLRDPDGYYLTISEYHNF